MVHTTLCRRLKGAGVQAAIFLARRWSTIRSTSRQRCDALVHEEPEAVPEGTARNADERGCVLVQVDCLQNTKMLLGCPH
jgi:hypothetical protein